MQVHASAEYIVVYNALHVVLVASGAEIKYGSPPMGGSDLKFSHFWSSLVDEHRLACRQGGAME